MEIVYRRAAMEDIDILSETRAEVLRAANQLPEDTDMGEVKKRSYDYYEHALPSGRHIAYLAYDGERIAATGGISFFQVMPTYHNISGEKAYIMNMYTAPEYRRQGIAYQMLDRLIGEARERGITAISLEATDMGRPLYEKYGFQKMKHEMELPV